MPTQAAGKGDLSGRELTMQTPAAGTPPDLSGRELTMQTPAAGTPPDLSGRELTMQTPASGAGLSGRELTMQTPSAGGSAADLSGRELTLQSTEGGPLSGRERTIGSPGTPAPTTPSPTPTGMTPSTAGGRPGTGAFKPRTGVGSSGGFDDAWHLQGRKGPYTGHTWGDFELGGIAGEGGMGAVYRAKQKSLRRRVAIKVLPPNLAADQRLLSRFRLEATTASKLQTPHVVQVYAIGEHDGNNFYAMEFIEGQDLYDILKERRDSGKPLTPDEAANYILQAAKGLAEAGRQGIVHRDIKPPNLMVTKDGHLKIADFGIVKVLGEHNLTMTGQAVGTPAYVSPEQGRGDRTVDCRSDLYSLGVVFYELVCGKKPFDGTTPNALIYQHCYEEPKLPKEINPAVTDELQAVILRCLQKKPENRYQTADELVRDLELIRTGAMLKSAIASYKLGTGAEEAKREQMSWLQRNLLPVAAAALLVVLGGGWAGYSWLAKSSRADLDRVRLEGEAKRKADTERLTKEQKIVSLRTTLAARLDVVAPVGEDTEKEIVDFARVAPLGDKDPDVMRWRAKMERVREFEGRLMAVDGKSLGADARTAAAQDLESYIALVSGDDVKARRWDARLKELKRQEDVIRAECAKLDSQALRKGDRDRFVPLLTQLATLVPASDANLKRWNGLIADFDKDLARLQAAIAPLDAADKVTLAAAERFRPVLTELAQRLDPADPNLARWTQKLDEAGGRIERLRAAVSETWGTQPDRIGAPKWDQAKSKFDDYRALAGDENPFVKGWIEARASAGRAEVGDRERLLKLLKDAGDEILHAGLVDAAERDAVELASLVYPDDKDLVAAQTRIRLTRTTLTQLTADTAVLDPARSEPLTLAVQAALTGKLDRLEKRGGIEAERAVAFRQRLGAERTRVAELRASLSAFDRAETITDAMERGLDRLVIDAGSDDPDVRRWTTKRDRVAELRRRIGALDRKEGVPEDVQKLFDELAQKVGEKDPQLVAWQGKVSRISEARSALRVLDRIATFDGPETKIRLAALGEMVGSSDRQWLRWRAKADEVAALKAHLAPLGTALALSPDADRAARTRLHRLVADLVGAEDPEARTAALRLDQLDGPPRPVWAVDAGRDRFGPWAEADLPGGKLRFRYLAPGAVVVGSPDDEPGRDDDELQVRLRLTHGFWLAEIETPQALWTAAMGQDPSRTHGDPAVQPVERVTWTEAQEFCRTLSGRQSGFAARLPLEAEWEYACRAGSGQPWNLPSDLRADLEGVGKVAWTSENAGGQPRPSRSRLPNVVGLFDLHGNLAEWCADAYLPWPTSETEVEGPAVGGDRRVLRGGSWGDTWLKTRAANRIPARADLRSVYVGVRLAVDADWGGRTVDGTAVLAQAVAGKGRGQVDLDLGVWRLRLERTEGGR